MDGEHPDDRYPGGPLPRHERVWRHPSEVGEAIWRRTEPQLAIGRGLLFTTGAIGGLLALAVLWATLPTNAGSSVAVVTTELFRSGRSAAASGAAAGGTADIDQSSGSTVHVIAAGKNSPATTLATLSVDEPANTANPFATVWRRPSQTDGDPTSESASQNTSAGGLAPAAVGVGTPGKPRPPSTVAVAPRSAGARGAVAVPLGEGTFVVTTAEAVQSTRSLTVKYDDGKTVQAKVVMVFRGLAVLSPDIAADPPPTVQAFSEAATTQPGELLTVQLTATDQMSVRVNSSGGVNSTEWGDQYIAEGTPAVNQSGQLVGLYSRNDDGAQLLPAGDVAKLRTAMKQLADPHTSPATGTPTGTAASPAIPPGKSPDVDNTAAPIPSGGWLGIQLNASPSGSLTVNTVDPDGPAATGGIVAGDTIVALDGVAVASN
ncbi:MAG: PDZ domain-containing protein, partial [Ilumatobacteraceae bacterium]